jgi:hypothetical protein
MFFAVAEILFIHIACIFSIEFSNHPFQEKPKLNGKSGQNILLSSIFLIYKAI